MIASKSRGDTGICCGGSGAVSEPERVSLELEVEPPQSVWHGKAAQLREGPRPGHPKHQLEARDENSGAHSALDQES